MSSLIHSLKSEIARIARKELKDELLALRKVTATHRSEIAALKRQVKTLTSGLKATVRASKASAKNVPAVDEKAGAPRIRFSAERFAAQRAKFGITQAQMAQLLGASSLSVFKWESGAVHPRAAQLQKIAVVMKMGKREALGKLEAGGS